jgi:hypothetical protein
MKHFAEKFNMVFNIKTPTIYHTIYLGATCSAIQIIALIFKDQFLGHLVNLTPTQDDQIKDIYGWARGTIFE